MNLLWLQKSIYNPGKWLQEMAIYFNQITRLSYLHKQLPAGIVLCAFKLSSFCFLIIKKVKDGKWKMAQCKYSFYGLTNKPHGLLWNWQTSYTICRQLFGTAEQEIELIFPVLALCTMHTPFAKYTITFGIL